MELFDDISCHHIPWEENQMVDALATLASMFKVSPHGDFPYIEFRCHVQPAHCCLIEEEEDGMSSKSLHITELAHCMFKMN